VSCGFPLTALLSVVAAAFAARFSTPAEYEWPAAQFSSASCGYRFSFPRLR
jgi:hypothetical protein